MRNLFLLIPISLLVGLASACQAPVDAQQPALEKPAAAAGIYNLEATVPPQCYTRSRGRFNPCYTCHQSHGDRPNRMADGYLQASYDFSDFALENHWKNLFVDRRPAIAATGDAEILRYIGQDNYTPLAARLRARGWQGYIPDLKDLQRGSLAVDAEGFARDGSGWRAFNYKPLPSTFWPSNGSTDDVFIRLPAAFRQDTHGRQSRAVYRVNLAILEAAIQDLPEVRLRPDDGALLPGRRTLRGVSGFRIRRPDHYVGAAAGIPVTPLLYPAGVEFLHSVRYLGVDRDGGIVAPPRLKELRYMRKAAFLSPAELNNRYDNEHQEKQEDALPAFDDLGERGLANSFGWVLQGFIEDRDGALRPQTHEEQLFCMGCHSAVGASIDQSFAFPRKVAGPAGWGYIKLKGMRDAPQRGQREGEILQYFRRVGGGDEFRENREILSRFFHRDGRVDAAKVRRADVYRLVTPSRARALALNKAYLSIVREQSFIYGRDAVLRPMTNVFRAVDPDTAPTLPVDKQYRGDIRLNWD